MSSQPGSTRAAYLRANRAPWITPGQSAFRWENGNKWPKLLVQCLHMQNLALPVGNPPSTLNRGKTGARACARVREASPSVGYMSVVLFVTDRGAIPTQALQQ